MRAMEQLPSYVERVASGGRDVPLALLPLLNDLRAVRGGALLSEGTLLLLNLRSDEPARPAADSGAGLSVVDLARRLRPRFQLALLGWIRGESVGQNLEALADIASQFESSASTKPLFQLWWVVSSVLEALQQGGIDGSASVKRLLGQVDRELRRLHEQGEQQYSDSPPIELLNNLLFYVARSRTAGPRVAGVRESFRLDEVLAVDERVDEARETLSAPSVRLMKTVAAAIREDLTRVKDVLDIFVRKGANQVEDLLPQLEMLRKISDTLGVLGLGALRDRVQGEIESLRGIVDRRVTPDESSLLGIAAALIEVEDSLDSQLVKLILPEPSAHRGEAPDEEFRHVQEAVLRECIVNMARIKEAITQALGAPAEAQGLDQVPQLVRGITAGLLMLGKQRAVEVMEGVGHALGSIVRPDSGSFAVPRLDRLADAIVAVEYYMEMLQAGRPDPWHMLENAEACLAELEQIPLKVVALRPPRAVEPFPAPAVAPAPAAFAPPVAAQEARPAPPAPVAPHLAEPTAVDPEFRQLFVEEARENIARLEELFPQWEQNPLDAQALRDLRRVFHTLKGSGRMVGARRVSEFSWSIESVLNRVISATLPRSPDIVDIVRDAVATMPKLVDELELGREQPADLAGIMARADALSGREATGVPPLPPAPAPAPAPAVVPAPAVEPQGMDPVLQEIFRKETAGHVAVVRQFMERCSQSMAPYAVTEALYRACHTLSGIAKTAGVRQGIKVAEPMEHYVRKLHDNGHGLPEEGLALLRDTVRSLENVVAHVAEDTGFFPDHGRLIAGWHALDRALDAELAQLTEAGERTVAAVWQPEEAAAVPADLTELLLASLAAQFEVPPRQTSQTSPHLLMQAAAGVRACA
jgi:chemosensory pili system protein ChpA (sensor histidine kinase/response regulator)